MIVKGVIHEDFTNYCKPCMYIAFPKCSFKCDYDCGKQVCQNSTLATLENYEIDAEWLAQKYISNDITRSIVCSGLEPFDTFDQLINFIKILRLDLKCNDDVVIFSGYREDEIEDKISELKKYSNIIVKFGRYIPDSEMVYDQVLGVNLSSDNQYAKRVS